MMLEQINIYIKNVWNDPYFTQHIKINSMYIQWLGGEERIKEVTKSTDQREKA